jgi:methyl-accepting chemotaxis protein
MSVMDSRVPLKQKSPKPFSFQQLVNLSKREQRFLAPLSIALGATFIFVTLNLLLVYLLSGQAYSLILVFLALGGIGICSLSFFLSRRTTTVDLGSWLLLGYTNVAIGIYFWFLGVEQPLPVAFFITMLLSLFLLPWTATLSFSLLELACIWLFFIFHLNGYDALIHLDRTGSTLLAMAFWIPLIFLPTGLGIYLWLQQKKSFELILDQARQLNQAMEEIEGKRQFGESVSQHIRTVTAELNATAAQQTTGSSSQVSTLIEVTEFLKELSYTAQKIADKAGEINYASEQMLTSARQVGAKAVIVAEASEQGLKSVEQTVERNQEVNELYVKLVGILTNLEQRSGEIKNILSLMQGISNETHLLALNAAIEAAGAGEYGERFAVVAGEVKALSDRSLKASREIGEILSKVELNIAEAALAANSGQATTQAAVSVARESGAAINMLVQTLRESAHEIGKIEQGLYTMHELTGEISFATNQQSSASDQAVASLQEVGTVAQQGASGSEQITSTAHELEELSLELSQVLAA